MGDFFKSGVESGELGGDPKGQFAQGFTDFLGQLFGLQPSGGTPARTVKSGGMTVTKAGTPSGDPISQTEGIAGTIQDLLAGPNIAGTGESIQKIIESDIDRGAANLRERFTASGGGSSVGTPAAVAESLFRAESAPRAGVALAQLDIQRRDSILKALAPLLGLGGTFTGMGTPQAGSYAFQTPSTASQLADLAKGVGSVAGGVSGGG